MADKRTYDNYYKYYYHSKPKKIYKRKRKYESKRQRIYYLKNREKIINRVMKKYYEDKLKNAQLDFFDLLGISDSK